MKIFSSVIWIKAVALISVLMMNICRADLSLSEIESTLQCKIATDSSQVVVNPEGPLNFLRGYIYKKMELMYNKRFFSPEINTYYSLKTGPGMFDEENTFIYNRDRQVDKAYTALPDNKMDKYAEQYHNHLIDLFPSPTGDVTLETRGNQSLVQFLRAKDTEEHSLKILALLLLFSEGMITTIEVNNKRLKVYETSKKDKVYFEVPMIIPWFNKETNETQRFEQKKVKQIIKFFQEYAADPEVLSLMEEKCSQEEIATGKFLDSPKFLIQSYIFGFIDTAEHAKEFIQAVHTMAMNYALDTEAPNKDDSAYDRLFKPSSTAIGKDCLGLMKESQDILNTYQVFPFANSTQVPAYTSVPSYNRETKKFSTSRLEDYSNCVDCAILSLFCCLTYDPSDFKYKTDHIGDITDELEEFFSLKNQPFDTTKVEFQKEWCKVVADLSKPSIAYCKGRNELDTGILNMLMVIIEIVKAPKEDEDTIRWTSNRLKQLDGQMDAKLCDDIKNYTTEVLMFISRQKNIKIEFSDLICNKCADGRYDIFGEITIIFEHSSIKNTIVFETYKEHTSFDMEETTMDFEDNRVEKLYKTAKSCKNGAAFVENLLSVYLDYEIRKMDTSKNNDEFMKAEIQKTIDNNFADINRLLFIKKINELDYKRDLITCLIVHSMDKNLLPDHPVVRFTSNIIGSTELDNQDIQAQVLSSIIFSGLHNINGNNRNYPNIKLSTSSYKNDMEYIRHHYLVKYVLDPNMTIFMAWIRYCIENFGVRPNNDIFSFLDSTVVESIFKYIFRERNIKYVNALDEAIAKEYPGKKDEVLNSLHNVWFMCLILQENIDRDIESIKTSFHAIRQLPESLPVFVYLTSNVISTNFKKIWPHLCSDDECVAKFDKFAELYLHLPRKWSDSHVRG
ncbi:hypothetical protein NEAUS04_0921 [Nematocida ausubeli]|nr:hypothetical protein NEAUS04_0921 [Nematocida ausubeli]